MQEPTRHIECPGPAYIIMLYLSVCLVLWLLCAIFAVFSSLLNPILSLSLLLYREIVHFHLVPLVLCCCYEWSMDMDKPKQFRQLNRSSRDYGDRSLGWVVYTRLLRLFETPGNITVYAVIINWENILCKIPVLMFLTCTIPYLIRVQSLINYERI